MGNKQQGDGGDASSQPPAANGMSKEKRGKSFKGGAAGAAAAAAAASAAGGGAADAGGSSERGFDKRTKRTPRYDDLVLFKYRFSYDDVRFSERVERFLKEGGDPNYVPNVLGLYDWTLLHWAAFYRATASIKLLVGKGANVNLKSTDGDVPAKIAKNVGASSEILRLLEAGRLLGGRT